MKIKWDWCVPYSKVIHWQKRFIFLDAKYTAWKRMDSLVTYMNYNRYSNELARDIVWIGREFDE